MKNRIRREITVDKVAMVSLPLLLLIFLLMVVRPKTWLNSAVDLPEATFQVSDREGDDIHILLKNGKCALVLDSALRAPCLKEMSKKYQTQISQQQTDKFSKMQVTGAAMKDMDTFINTHSPLLATIDERFGIPIDSASNEMSDWITVANNITQQLSSRKLNVALLCDKNEPYANVKQIKRALEKACIYKVAIVYTPRPISQNN